MNKDYRLENTEDKLIKQSLSIKKVITRLEKDIELHSELLIDAIAHGQEATDKWSKTNDQLHYEIETNERKLEELISYIAVGYPAYKTTNASSVIDVYNKKVSDYKKSWSVWIEDCEIATNLTLNEANIVKDNWIMNGHKDVEVQRGRL